MSTQKIKPSKGVLGSKALSLGVGYATGGLAGGAIGLASANNPAIAQAAQIYKATGGITGNPIADTPISDTFTKPEIGDSFKEKTAIPGPNLGVVERDNPLARRFSLTGQSPHEYAAQIQNGLDALKEVRDQYPGLAEEYAPALLQAKHFHIGADHPAFNTTTERV